MERCISRWVVWCIRQDINSKGLRCRPGRVSEVSGGGRYSAISVSFFENAIACHSAPWKFGIVCIQYSWEIFWILIESLRFTVLVVETCRNSRLMLLFWTVLPSPVFFWEVMKMYGPEEEKGEGSKSRSFLWCAQTVISIWSASKKKVLNAKMPMHVCLFFRPSCQ